MKVGFIGLGNMGAAMAANLLKAGHEVTVYNRTPEKARTLAAQGAQIARSVSEACRGAPHARRYLSEHQYSDYRGRMAVPGLPPDQMAGHHRSDLMPSGRCSGSPKTTRAAITSPLR